MSKIGRNDPCPCGSKKKYKSCCGLQNRPPVRKQFKATLISGGQIAQGNPLIERTFSSALSTPPEPPKLPKATIEEKPKE